MTNGPVRAPGGPGPAEPDQAAPNAENAHPVA